MIKNKDHLTEEGLRQIVALKASLNKGLSDELKSAFPNITPAILSNDYANTVLSPVQAKRLDPYWITGFTSGDGSFYIRLANNSTFKLGVQVQLIFQITQDYKELEVMESIVHNLDCGQVRKRKYIENKDNCVDYMVTKFSDIDQKIIPFFSKYKIFGVKSEDFNDWLKVSRAPLGGWDRRSRGNNLIKFI